MLQLARVGWRKFSALKLSMRLLPRPRLVDPRRGSFVRSHRAAAVRLVHVLVFVADQGGRSGSAMPEPAFTAEPLRAEVRALTRTLRSFDRWRTAFRPR
jgi:hypothetical protein